MSKIKIGWAEENIVPDKKIMLAGQFYERISEYVEDPITATAMAIEADGEQAVLVSVDIVKIMDELLLAVKERVAELNIGIDPKKVSIGATHVHTAMLYQKRKDEISETAHILNEFLPEDNQYQKKVEPDDSVMTAEECLDFLVEKITNVIKNAWENRKESLYANEFGRAAVGMCRRVVYDDGSAKMWGETTTPNFVSLEGGNDSGIELLYIFDVDKKLTGIVANIACPAQILEHRSFISADYWGAAKRILREKFGNDIYLLAICGAGGDQCPRDLVRWVNAETPINDPNIIREHYIERKADPSMFDLKGCRLAGKRVANEIISVYEEITDIKSEAVFKHNSFTFDLPLRRVTISEYENAVESIYKYVDRNKGKEKFDYVDNAAMYIHAGTIARYRAQQDNDIVPIEMHIIRFGDVAFATNPFELFLDYGNQIRARSRAKQTFISQLTSGALGYLPTEKAEKGSHYSAYVSSGFVGHVGGEMLVRKTVEEINKMF